MGGKKPWKKGGAFMHTVMSSEIQTYHEKDFIIKRQGNKKENLWVILCFSNACMIQTATGMREAQAGDCFFKSPEFIEYHYTPDASGEGFVNDWMHVQSDSMGGLLRRLGLPANTLIRTQHPEIMRSSMQKIQNEKRKQLPYSGEYIHNLVEHIVIKIARTAKEVLCSNSRKYEEELLGLRQELQSRLDRQWTVREMADEVGLSSSRLSVLYKKRFGLSPNEDLIQMRIEKSKILLLSTNLKLQHISQLCGFKNEYYFSRIFKERENTTPGAYRRWE